MLAVAAAILLGSAAALIAAATLGMFTFLGAVLIVLGSATLTALATWAGEYIRRIDAEEALKAQEARRGLADTGWLLDGFDPRSIRRKVRTIVITFAVTLLISLGVTAILGYFGDDGDADRVPAVLAMAVNPFVAGGFVCAFTVFTLSRRFGRLTGGNTRLQSRVARAVLRPHKELSEPLTPVEMTTAAQYATLQVVYLPFESALVAFVITGVTIQQVSSLIDPNAAFPVFSIVFVILLPVMLVVLLFKTRTRLNRARQFRDARLEASRSEGSYEQTKPTGDGAP